MLEISPADNEIGMAGRNDLADVRFERILHIQPDHLGTVGHQRVDGPVTQAEHPLDDFLFHIFEDACFPPLLDQDLDFLFGNGRLTGRLDPKQAHHQLGRGAQKGHEWPGNRRDEPHKWCNRGGNSLGIVQCQPLGDQLTNDQGKIGDHGHHDPNADGSTVGF